MSKAIGFPRIFSVFITVFVVGSTHVAWGWGEPGHKLINRSAAQLMQSAAAGFFQANSDNLATLATTPDLKWKDTNYDQEAMLHFFQWDAYSQSSIANLFPVDLSTATQKLGQSFLNTNGTSVWRSAQFYDLMVKALQTGDCATSLQMGGVMGHYIGDLSQPMHDTSDYDGQSIGDPGIHAYFETTLLNKQEQTALLAAVTTAGGQPHPEDEPATLLGSDLDVIEYGVLESQAAYAILPQLLADFTNKKPNDADLIAHFPSLLGRGAYVLAKVWDLAATRAGVTTATCESQAITVQQPAWIALSQ